MRVYYNMIKEFIILWLISGIFYVLITTMKGV